MERSAEELGEAGTGTSAWRRQMNGGKGKQITLAKTTFVDCKRKWGRCQPWSFTGLVSIIRVLAGISGVPPSSHEPIFDPTPMKLDLFLLNAGRIKTMFFN